MELFELINTCGEIPETFSKAELNELIKHLDTLESNAFKVKNLLVEVRLHKMMVDFGQKDSDIYVVSYPKSGTTLMQMIIYQLTSDGDMNFNHIYDVSPWLRFAARKNLTVKCDAKRRIIKSHDDYDFLKDIRKGKFIFVIRDCFDALHSYFIHTIDYEGPVISWEEFWQMELPAWTTYISEWLINRNHLDILYVNYENLITRKKDEIEKIARFIEIDLDDILMDRVLDRTSFQFMKKNETKFGEQPDSYQVFNNFIRHGLIGEGRKSRSPKEEELFLKLSSDFLRSNEHTRRYYQ
ncbi:MAG TPA: sulfotransferase domain-containing protein [Bacteroidales bacterium]|nr:sulfotransferase domain-containing protein [Bacteroidales bacterium]HPJ58801.1 sulfotransferase domain-containing protein [Bacteroidales bacterium]HPR11951.1 sulfotransferase domain-containing protein [Bacteroidales bacterium]HRW85757.1 sulfotransferase domain-containing protein [Bacteroidales bacterium]